LDRAKTSKAANVI